MKSVLKQTLAFLLAFALAASAVVLVLIVAVAVIGASQKPHVPTHAILNISLSEPLTEKGGPPSPATLLAGAERMRLAAHEAAAAVRHAAKDERIAGVLIHGGISGSVSALTALRNALGEVRAAGKPVLAYYGSGDERMLWLASAADELWMEPLGLLVLDGWMIDMPYFGDALKRYGIEVQVTRVGKYKSAVEPFVLGQMSAENREQLQTLLADIEAKIVGDIASAKKLDPKELETWMAERGWFAAPDAVEAGLATRAAPFGEMLDRLRGIAGVEKDEELPQIDLESYADAIRKAPKTGAGVQVIVAEGEIFDGESVVGIGGDELARRLRKAREDDDVKAVVMRVDSPGGSATGSDVIRREVLALKAAGKPVVVSMGRLAASGGYWISADADAIVAQPETITGSIGVFGMLPNVQKLAEDHGVRAERVQTSPLVGWDSIWHHKDERQIELVQAFVDQIYERFVDLVSEGRGLTRERVNEIAQGRVWSGARALELDLVDRLGGLDEAIALAKEKAELPKDAPVRYEREEPELFEEILEEALKGEPERLARALDARLDALGPLRRPLELASHLERLAGPGRVLARLPFDVPVD